MKIMRCRYPGSERGVGGVLGGLVSLCADFWMAGVEFCDTLRAVHFLLSLSIWEGWVVYSSFFYLYG